MYLVILQDGSPRLGSSEFDCCNLVLETSVNFVIQFVSIYYVLYDIIYIYIYITRVYFQHRSAAFAKHPAGK